MERMKKSFNVLICFPISFLLAFHVSACSKSDEIPAQLMQVERSLGQVEEGEATAIPNQSPEEMIDNLRHGAYSMALGNLKLVAERNPDILPVIQSLIEHPDQAYEMFDGCYNYWSDLGQTVNLSEQEWETELATRHYQSIPEQVQYLRAYDILPEKHLIMMNCWIGPYWEAVSVYLYDEAESTPQIKLLTFPTYNSETEEIDSKGSIILYGLPNYNEENHLLTLAHKYSGAGNCGFRAIYRLENDEFILTEFREQRECDEAVFPGDFPLVYP